MPLFAVLIITRREQKVKGGGCSNEDGTSELYFLCSLPSLNYSGVGFTLQCGEKQAKWGTTTVYRSVNLNGETFRSDQSTAPYLVALRLSGVPDAIAEDIAAIPWRSKTPVMSADTPKQKPALPDNPEAENAA